MLNATVMGGFAIADNIFFRENTLTFFKTQVERLLATVYRNFRGWLFYYFLPRIFLKKSAGNLVDFVISKDG
jgi:hypothetical protein